MILPPPLKFETAPTALCEVPRSDVPLAFRAITFIDLETSGLEPGRHDILEIGAVRVDPQSLEVLSEYEARVRPERIETAQPEALRVSGYSKAGWADAKPLREALLDVAPLLDGTLVAGHNVGFDWAFLEAAFRRTGLVLPRVDYHRLDTASLAWPLVRSSELELLSLDALARRFGIERPRPHRALADARCALEVARRLASRMELGSLFSRLEADERAIATALISRLDRGRKDYGPWHVDDGRDYANETYEEVLDGLHYAAAKLVRQRRLDEQRRRRVYVCHPFANDPEGNIEKVRRISEALIAEGVLPIAPHLYLPQLVDEASARETALSLCIDLLITSDEVRVYGERISEGMERELAEAARRGIPVHFAREVLA